MSDAIQRKPISEVLNDWMRTARNVPVTPPVIGETDTLTHFDLMVLRGRVLEMERQIANTRRAALREAAADSRKLASFMLDNAAKSENRQLIDDAVIGARVLRKFAKHLDALAEEPQP